MLEYTLRTYQSPTRLVQRLGAIRELGNEAGLLGIRRPLLVTDPGVKAAGLLDTALEVLRGSDCEPVVFDRVRANPGVELVDAGAAEYRSQGCDGLVAIGGGSSIDTAKGIGVVAAHDGSILDFEWGENPIAKRIPPMIAVPTTAGTGSEVTLWAVITDPLRKIKFNVGGTPNIASWVAVIDPELTVKLPPAVTAGTGMDALAHAVECYTMTYHQPFTDAVALLAMEYVARYLRVAFSQAANVEARYHMSAAAMLAGLAYGTDSAGAAHAMSQTAGGVHDAPHGALTARLLGPVMEYNHAGEPERFARMATAFGIDVRVVSTPAHSTSAASAPPAWLETRNDGGRRPLSEEDVRRREVGRFRERQAFRRHESRDRRGDRTGAEGHARRCAQGDRSRAPRQKADGCAQRFRALETAAQGRGGDRAPARGARAHPHARPGQAAGGRSAGRGRRGGRVFPHRGRGREAARGSSPSIGQPKQARFRPPLPTRRIRDHHALELAADDGRRADRSRARRRQHGRVDSGILDQRDLGRAHGVHRRGRPSERSHKPGHGTRRRGRRRGRRPRAHRRGRVRRLDRDGCVGRSPGGRQARDARTGRQRANGRVQRCRPRQGGRRDYRRLLPVRGPELYGR